VKKGEIMTLKEVLEHFGGVKGRVGKTFGASKELYRNWENAGLEEPPIVWQLAIEMYSKGKLKASYKPWKNK